MNNKKLIHYKCNLHNKVIYNFNNIKYVYLILPLAILLACALLFFFLNKEHNYIDGYITIQKDAFFYLNSKLAAFPNLEYNLTQLGDVIILFPFLSIFILYATKLWEAIITSSILSLLITALLKKIFSIPRPAAVLDRECFTIIGNALTGKNALPSGHCITSFIVITLVLIAFMPKKRSHQIIWSFTMLIFGILITFSRIGVGAHYPLDVIVGSTIGFILAIIGIKLNKQFNWFAKLKIKNSAIYLIPILLIWIVLVIHKIITLNIIITYLSLLSLIVTLYLIVKKCLKQNIN